LVSTVNSGNLIKTISSAKDSDVEITAGSGSTGNVDILDNYGVL